MSRAVVLIALAVGLLVSPMAAAEDLPIVQFVEAGEAARSQPLVGEPASYDRAMSDPLAEVEVAGRCSRSRLRGIDVTMRWTVSRQQFEALRVDLSLFHEGFKRGRFLTSGNRAVAERGLVFQEALPGVYYYWRLLSRTPEGWVVSGAGRFDTPVCPVDEVQE